MGSEGILFPPEEIFAGAGITSSKPFVQKRDSTDALVDNVTKTTQIQ
jgi:hypothetical protein